MAELRVPDVPDPSGKPVGEVEHRARHQEHQAHQGGAAVDKVHQRLEGKGQHQRQAGHNQIQGHTLAGEVLSGGPAPVGPQTDEAEATDEDAADVPAVHQHHRRQSAQMQQHVEEQIRLLHRKDVLEDHQMPGAGYGQKLRQPLDQPQQQRAEI